LIFYNFFFPFFFSYLLEDASTKNLSDAALSAVSALSQCKQHLVDVLEGARLAGVLLYQLLTTYLQVENFAMLILLFVSVLLLLCLHLFFHCYSIPVISPLTISQHSTTPPVILPPTSCRLQVCMSAASVLGSLSLLRDEAGWYGRALRVADLVACEDQCLLLYTLLRPSDLEALLLAINAAAIALVNIDPDMQMEKDDTVALRR
jgi:hypothetical protein